MGVQSQNKSVATSRKPVKQYPVYVSKQTHARAKKIADRRGMKLTRLIDLLVTQGLEQFEHRVGGAIAQ